MHLKKKKKNYQLRGGRNQSRLAEMSTNLVFFILKASLRGTGAPDLLIGTDQGSENCLRMLSAVLRMRSVLSDPGSFPISRSGASVPPSYC